MKWIITGAHCLDSSLRVSTYHLVTYLASRAHNQGVADPQVLYLPSPISPWHYMLKRNDERFIERRTRWGFHAKHHLTGALEYVPMSLTPALNKFPFDNPTSLKLSLRLTVPPLRGVITKVDFFKPDILCVSNLQYAWLDRLVKPRCLIYRCVDDITGFEHAPKSLAHAEKQLIKRADFCVATSETLAERLRERGASNVTVIRNAVEFDEYSDENVQMVPADIARIPHPRIVYLGIIDQRFDIELMARTIARLPNYQFILIGPSTIDLGPLRKFQNIHFLGARPADQVAAYLKACHAGIIPFKVDRLVESVCPIKLYYYLAAGLPVVSTRWKEMERLKSPAALASTPEEFITALQSLPYNIEARKERMDFASSQSWHSRFQELERLATECVQKSNINNN